MKVTDYIAKYLLLNGVKTVFGYQGSSIAHLIDSISLCDGMDFVEMRHEQGAAFAANGAALANNKLGVAISCSGPGALNLVTGIADAWYDSLPCVFITGQVSQKEMKTDPTIRQCGFQETDVVSVVSSITKYAVSIKKPEDIPEELKKAITIAISGRKGPVLLDIPHNIQGSQIVADMLDAAKSEETKGIVATNIEKLITTVKRPVILIGGGSITINTSTQQVLEQASIPVVTSYRGKTKIDNTIDTYCGTIGAYGERYANWALKYSDLIICIGSRLDGRQTLGEPLQLSKQQNIIVCDIDEAELRKYPAEYHKICADAKDFMDAIILILQNKNFTEWLSTIKQWKKRHPVGNEYDLQDKVNPNFFLAMLSGLLNETANITVDVGQNQLWSNTSLVIKEKQNLIQSCGLGAMGFALPAAIGAYKACPAQTICITGDGGMQMNSQELQTVVQNNIPLKVIVLNNSCLGLIRDYQSKALGGRYYGSIVGFGSPQYQLLAQAYGLRYMCVEDDNTLANFENVLGDDQPYIIEVKISQQSTGCPEPTYGKSIVDQSKIISEDEKKRVEEEAYVCR